MPDIGYPDFQRVVNWDSPVLYSGSVTNETTYVQSGALDVSRYAYMGGYMQCYVGYCTVTLEWFLDQAMTVIVGQREFTLEQHIANICQPKIAHMGPFLQVTFEAISNAQFTADWSLFATNRSFPLEFVPVLSVLTYLEDVALPPGQNLYYPGSYYSGPLTVWAQSTGEAIDLRFEYLDIDAVWKVASQSGVAAGAQQIYYPFAPIGAWRINSYNLGTSNAQWWLSVSATTTGAT